VINPRHVVSHEWPTPYEVITYCILYIIHHALYDVQCTMHNVKCTIYVHYTLYIIQYIYIVNFAQIRELGPTVKSAYFDLRRAAIDSFNLDIVSKVCFHCHAMLCSY
jgi:hypothetical protein